MARIVSASATGAISKLMPGPGEVVVGGANGPVKVTAAVNLTVVLPSPFAGQALEVVLPLAATVTGWTVVADQAGSIVVTVSRATYANYPTLTAISGTQKPTLASAAKAQSTSLSTWTTALAAGDILSFSVDSATTITRATVTLTLARA